MSKRFARSCGIIGIAAYIHGRRTFTTSCTEVKKFKTNSHMMRGQKVETESYKLSFGRLGSCRVFKACAPPQELTFPSSGWSIKPSAPRSELVVEAVRELCGAELSDGTSAALFARGIVLPDGPFQKLVVVSNLRKLLKLQLPSESFKQITEAGSTLYRLDVGGSDHDIEVVFRGNAADERIKEWLWKALQAAQLDAQERVERRTRSKDYHELATAHLEPFECGVRIQGFPEGTEWDVVATKWERGSPVHHQYDPTLGCWKPMLSGYIKPIVEGWWQSKPKLFLAVKLLKMWNSNLPKLRRKACPRTGSVSNAAPLSSFHLVLMAIAAAPGWDERKSLEAACCFLLRFIRSHRLDPSVTTNIPTAEEHLKRIILGYSGRKSPDLALLDKHIDEAISALETLPSLNEDAQIKVVERLFGPLEDVTPGP